MTRPLHIAAIAMACCLLAGCASYSGAGLRPGESTEADVVAVMGRPALAFDGPDGSRRLAFPRGPLGTQTFMADVDRTGRLLAVTPVLNDDTFWRIQPGMKRGEVLRTIGPPGNTMAFPLSGNDAWDYRYMDTWGYLAIFSVTFDRNDTVVSKITQRIERDRPR